MSNEKLKRIRRENILKTAASIILFLGVPALVYDLNYEGDWAGIPSFLLLIFIIIPSLLFIFIPWFIWFIFQYIELRKKAFEDNIRSLLIALIVFFYAFFHYFLIILFKW